MDCSLFLNNLFWIIEPHKQESAKHLTKASVAPERCGFHGELLFILTQEAGYIPCLIFAYSVPMAKSCQAELYIEQPSSRGPVARETQWFSRKYRDGERQGTKHKVVDWDSVALPMSKGLRQIAIFSCLWLQQMLILCRFADTKGPSFTQPLYMATSTTLKFSTFGGIYVPDASQGLLTWTQWSWYALALLERHQGLGLPIPTEAFLTVKVSQCGRGKKH